MDHIPHYRPLLEYVTKESLNWNVFNIQDVINTIDSDIRELLKNISDSTYKQPDEFDQWDQIVNENITKLKPDKQQFKILNKNDKIKGRIKKTKEKLGKLKKSCNKFIERNETNTRHLNDLVKRIADLINLLPTYYIFKKWISNNQASVILKKFIGLVLFWRLASFINIDAHFDCPGVCVLYYYVFMVTILTFFCFLIKYITRN